MLRQTEAPRYDPARTESYSPAEVRAIAVGAAENAALAVAQFIDGYSVKNGWPGTSDLLQRITAKYPAPTEEVARVVELRPHPQAPLARFRQTNSLLEWDGGVQGYWQRFWGTYAEPSMLSVEFLRAIADLKERPTERREVAR